MGRAPHGLFAPGHHQPPRVSRGHGLRGGQAEPGAREGLHGDVPRQLQERRRPADGRSRARLPHQRQLGGGRCELDRPDDPGVHEAARLRSAPVAARAHGPGGRECRSLRPFPLGLPTRAVGHAGGVPLRPDHRDPEAARHGALRRVARGRTRLHRRRHGGEAHERRADVGDVDAAAGRQRRASPLQRRHPRIGLGRTPLREDLRRRGVHDRRLERLGLVPGDPQAHRRQGAGDGPEPVRHPHVGPPAARGQGAGPQPRTLRPVVHAQRDLGGAGERLGDVSRPQLLPAAARPLRGRRPVLLRRRHERDRSLRRQGSAGAGRLQLRLRQRRCPRAPGVGRGRPARDTERHALPRARARSEQPAHVVARTPEDPRPRLGRRGRGRTEASVDTQPERRRGRVPPPGRPALGHRDRGRCRQDREGDRLGRRQPGGRPEAPGRAARLRAHEAPAPTRRCSPCIDPSPTGISTS